jgi:hypothetical protein
MRKSKVGAPTIHAPGTENKVSVFNPHNKLRVITTNPPQYLNYVKDKDGSTDV